LRVLIITGSYPPDNCGVGDYTLHLAEALAARPDIEVGVLTSVSAPTTLESSSVKVFRIMPNWSIKRTQQIKQFVSEFKPDIVHIQYPTQRYNGWLPKYLPLLFRLMGLSVAQTWHEHYTECDLLGWKNLLACNALIYVRPDFLQKIPAWVRMCLGKTPLFFVPNASTIPVVLLNVAQAQNIKQRLSGGKPIACYFGFAYSNKGMEQLFEIADPTKHHIVLICELSDKHPYQANILKLANQAPWIGKVTITGFQSAHRVGEILSVADAVIFPFTSGAGEWNTSLKAAESAGAFTIATTQDKSLLGYQEASNIYYAACNHISDMKEALNRYIGTRKISVANDDWKKIAITHEQLYRELY
jgi:glycosyltransferase involved in cell wall biosynthesis